MIPIVIPLFIGLFSAFVYMICRELEDPIYTDRFYIGWFSFLAAMMIVIIAWIYSEVGFI